MGQSLCETGVDVTPSEPTVRLITEVGSSRDGSGREVVRITGVWASPGALPPDRMALLESCFGMEYPVEQLEPFLADKTSEAVDPETLLTVFEPGEVERILKRMRQERPGP